MKLYNYFIGLILSVVCVSMTSCYTNRTVGLLQERSSLPEYDKGKYELYHLQMNDEIQIRVLTSNKETANLFQSNQRSNNIRNGFSYRIHPDGTVDIPFLGRVYVQGMSLDEIETVLTQKVRKFTEDAYVKVALTTGTFCVIGDAGRGYFPIYKERLTIYQAMALFGGVNNTADFSSIKIIRRNLNGETEIKTFDIRSQSIIESDYYYIYPNDIIYVDVSRNGFWGIASYSAALGIINSSFTLFFTVWTLLNK